MLKTSEPGTPVVLKVNGNLKASSDRMFLRVLSLNKTNINIVNCITPHGSIISASRANMDVITDEEELMNLKTLEEHATQKGYNPYNGLIKISE